MYLLFCARREFWRLSFGADDRTPRVIAFRQAIEGARGAISRRMKAVCFMNFIKQLKAFEDYSDRTGLPPCAQLLYHKLFMINNAANWAEWFHATNPYLMLKVGVKDRKTFDHHRNLLKQNGLIDFISGTRKGQPTKYKLMNLYADSESLSTDPGEGGILGGDFSSPSSSRFPPELPPEALPIENKINIKKYDTGRGETKSDCPSCGGRGWYVGKEPFNNGLGVRDAVVSCACRLKKRTGQRN